MRYSESSIILGVDMEANMEEGQSITNGKFIKSSNFINIIQLMIF